MKRTMRLVALLSIAMPCVIGATRIHDLSRVARGGDVWTEVGGTGPKDFIIHNATGHIIYARIGFNVCQAEGFSNFRSGGTYGVRKQGGCIPTLVSGYVWIGGKMDRGEIVGGKQVPLVAWRPGGNRLPGASRRHDAAFGAGWVVRMNPDGETATVYFAGGFSLSRPTRHGNDAGRLQRSAIRE